MVEYTKEHIQKVAGAHRRFGFSVRVQNRKDKQYITFSSKGVKFKKLAFRRTGSDFQQHIKSIFPNAYVTSGMYGSDYFEITYRINP